MHREPMAHQLHWLWHSMHSSHVAKDAQGWPRLAVSPQIVVAVEVAVACVRKSVNVNTARNIVAIGR